MQGSGSAYPPEGSGPKRGLFPRRNRSEAQPLPPGLEDLIATYQRGVEERLEEGLRAIQQTAVSLMHEIAAEMWRASSGDVRDAQSQILSLISRDQAIRSLIAHSDERFQALAVRTARLEDTIAELAESTRALKEVLARGARALAEAASSPALRGVEEVREELARIEEHIAQAFKHLAERDLALVESIRAKVREHGELVAQETSRIAEAIQGYVSSGVDAMGRLAQRTEGELGAARDALEGQLEAVRERIEGELGATRERIEGALERIRGEVEEHIASDRIRDEEIADAFGRTVREQVERLERTIAEQGRGLADAFKSHEGWVIRTTEAVGDRLDRTLEEHGERIDRSLEAQGERLERALAGQTQAITEATREATLRTAQELHRAFEARVMGLAQLVRSDSERLRDKLVEVASGLDERTARLLDDRLGQVTELLGDLTRLTAEETVRRVAEAAERAVSGRFEEVVSAIDRNVVRLADTLETELERVGREVGQRAAEAAETSVATHVGETARRLESSIEAVERLRERMDLLGSRLDRLQGDAQASLARHVDERVAALARMIRSDNRILAERIQQAAEQEPAKQALRAVKELQASLAAEIVERMDRRFAAMAEQLHRETQAMAESVARSTEVLSERIERMASRVQEAGRPGRELQEVIERMGDAMHAIASLSRPDPERVRVE
jgi:ABC-type transporter Mla subunit MlaD